MMAEDLVVERNEKRDDGRRPPRAAVGSHRIEEEMFGRMFDRHIVRRIWVFVRPYRLQAALAVAAVLIFSGSQLVIPLIIRYAIDNGMSAGAVDKTALGWAIGLFGLAILINYAAS
jgi:ATP-binding cassette subfamily B protein